jgi:hypothetical protein
MKRHTHLGGNVYDDIFIFLSFSKKKCTHVLWFCDCDSQLSGPGTLCTRGGILKLKAEILLVPSFIHSDVQGVPYPTSSITTHSYNDNHFE